MKFTSTLKNTSVKCFYHSTSQSRDADELRRLIYPLWCYCEQGYSGMCLATHCPSPKAPIWAVMKMITIILHTFAQFCISHAWFPGWPVVWSDNNEQMTIWILSLLWGFFLCKKNAEMQSLKNECGTERTRGVQENNLITFIAIWK